MNEIWKDIIGYEGLYQISNLGKILRWKKKANRWKSLNMHVERSGYYVLALCTEAKAKSFRLHRLLAIHFLPMIEGKNFINHKNGIKTDNRLENLEWCTNSENVKHAWETGLNTKDQIPRRTRAVRAFNILTNEQTDFKRIIDACAAFGLDDTTVVTGIKRQSIVGKKFRFEYLNV
jgi:hypothetical protein